MPYLTSHPGFMREDLLSISLGHIEGPWHAVDNATASGRPLVTMLYVVMFGVLWKYGLLLHVLLVILAAASACALYLLMRRFVGVESSLASVLVWLVLPTHLTFDHWLATTNVTLAVLLIAVAFNAMERALSRQAPLRLSIALLCLSLFLYEAYSLVILMGIVVLSVRQSHTFVYGEVARRLAFPALSMVGIVMLQSGRFREFAGVSAPLSANFGLTSSNVAFASLVAILLTIFSALATVRVLRGRVGEPEAMMLSGVAVFVCGAVPFLSNGFEHIYFGLGDRANIVASMGVAPCVVGATKMTLVRPKIVATTLAVFVVALVPIHVSRSHTWTKTEHQERNIAKDLLRTTPSSEPVSLRNVGNELDALGTNQRVEVDMWIRSGLLGPPRDAI